MNVKKVAVVAIMAAGLAVTSAKSALADIKINNENNNEINVNATANATATGGNASATGGNATAIGGGGTTSGGNSSNGSTNTTGGNASATGGTASSSAQVNTSVKESSETKIRKGEKNGDNHRDGGRKGRRFLPSTGSSMIVLALVAIAALIAAAFGVKRFSKKA